MSDSDVREIHLSGKQLVFLFMVSVVLAVAVFLLGVSVGRGVRANLGAGDPESVGTTRAADDSAPMAMPPPTVPGPGDLSYHDQLQGRGAGTAPPPPTPASPAPTTVSPTGDAMPVDEPQAPAAGAEAKPSSAAAAASAKTPAPSSAPASATGSTWIQAGVFTSKTNADTRAAKLKSSGFTAVVLPAPAGERFNVRVGPYAARADADRALVRVRRLVPDAQILR